jgi:hypothetical protein
LDDPDFHVMSSEIQRNDKGKIELERIWVMWSVPTTVVVWDGG